MKFKTSTIAGLVTVTTVAGTLTFNTQAAEKVMENIQALKLKIEQFANNDQALVTKYNNLREDAKNKINELEKEIETNNNLSNEEKEELNTEIQRLTAELTKANDAVALLETKSNEAVELANSYTMTKAESLPGLDGEVVEKTKATAHFYSDSINTTITLSEDINIDFWNSKGNVKVEYMSGGKAIFGLTKDKSWSGYLNHQENKYGQGHGIGGSNTDKTYSNQLASGVTYSTTLNKKDTNKFDSIDSVRVTVTNNDGDVLLKEIFKNNK